MPTGYPDYDPSRALLTGATPPGFPPYYPHPYASAHHSLFAAEAARMAEAHRAAVESQHRAAVESQHRAAVESQHRAAVESQHRAAMAAAAVAAEQKDSLMMARGSGNDVTQS